MTTILYGIPNKYIDITELASRVCERRNSFLIIPDSDQARIELFGDPCYGHVKHIKVNDEIFESSKECHVSIPKPENYIGNPHKKLQKIHEKLRFNGNLKDEYPEQIMAVSWILPDDRVLEIGSNIGRNTLVISSLLAESANLTTLETDPGNCVLLDQNRRANFFDFKIINGALSKRKLWQRTGGWETVPGEVSPGEGWYEVTTVDNIPCEFNVLVADCEGSLFYILQDFPDLLSGLRLIIVENDYRDVKQKEFVEEKFIQHGFKLVYCTNSHEAAYYGLPCRLEFFQVFRR